MKLSWSILGASDPGIVPNAARQAVAQSHEWTELFQPGDVSEMLAILEDGKPTAKLQVLRTIEEAANQQRNPSLVTRIDRMIELSDTRAVARYALAHTDEWWPHFRRANLEDEYYELRAVLEGGIPAHMFASLHTIRDYLVNAG